MSVAFSIIEKCLCMIEILQDAQLAEGSLCPAYRSRTKNPAGRILFKGKNMEQKFQVGIISSAHGIKGEAKVYPTTDDPARFKKLKKVLLDTGKEEKEVEIESVKFFKQFVILKFKGIDDRNEIERLRTRSLYVMRENAVRLKKNEYYIADLMDMKVREDNGEELGMLVDVMQTGANDVYVVKTPAGEEILLPAIKECILSVDVEQGEMIVHVMEGLRG